MFRFFLPISIWLLFDSGRMGKTRPWMRQSLFLYGIHFILVRVFNKAGALVLGRVLDGTAMAVLAVVWFLVRTRWVWNSVTRHHNLLDTAGKVMC